MHCFQIAKTLFRQPRNHVNLLKRTARYTGQRNISNLKKFSFFAASGSIGSFVLCGIWDYERTRNFLNYRKKPIITGKYLFYGIAAVNTVVTLCLRLNPNLIYKLWLHPTSHWSTLLTSVFTHHSFLHLFINMYVMNSFVGTIDNLGVPQFLAVYLSGGLISGVFSLFVNRAMKLTKPGVGASGSIFTVVAALCALYPQIKLGIPIVSDITGFSMQGINLVSVVMMFEAFSLVYFKDRSQMGHACHLGGALYGLFYGFVGQSSIWKNRKSYLSWYYKIRK